MVIPVPRCSVEEGGRLGCLVADRRRTSLASPSISFASSANSGKEAANRPSLRDASRREPGVSGAGSDYATALRSAHATIPKVIAAATNPEIATTKRSSCRSFRIARATTTSQARRSETLRSSDSAVPRGSGEGSSRALIWLSRNRIEAWRQRRRAVRDQPEAARSSQRQGCCVALGFPAESPELDRVSEDSASSGSQIVNVAPPPGLLCTDSRPACSLRISAARYNPYPVPFSLVVKKGSKRRSMYSSGTPGPSSTTSTRTHRPPWSWDVPVRTRIRPPRFELDTACCALLIRLKKTCMRRPASTRTRGVNASHSSSISILRSDRRQSLDEQIGGLA